MIPAVPNSCGRVVGLSKLIPKVTTNSSWSIVYFFNNLGMADGLRNCKLSFSLALIALRQWLEISISGFPMILRIQEWFNPRWWAASRKPGPKWWWNLAKQDTLIISGMPFPSRCHNSCVFFHKTWSSPSIVASHASKYLQMRIYIISTYLNWCACINIAV